MQKHDEAIAIRVPGDMMRDLEREQRRMSRAAGAEIKMSAVIRALIIEGVRLRRRSAKEQRA
jgi:hypothetical protein